MKQKSIIVIGIIVLGAIVSCSPTGNEILTQPSGVTVSTMFADEVVIPPTIEPSITATIVPTATSPQATSTLEPTATQNPYSGAEPYPTAIAFTQDDVHIQELVDSGYNLLFGSSTAGPDGFIYSAYIFIDATFPPSSLRSTTENLFPRAPYREVLSPEEYTEGCRIVFYRSDREMNEYMDSFGAPKYSEGGIYQGYPVSCLPNDWQHPKIISFGSPDDADRELLGLNGVWSDINQNGWPEFAVYYQYCGNACRNYGAISTHLYEIQAQSRVENITADLPGVLEVFHIVHSKAPVDFYVYDPTLWYCYKWCIIDTWWIYAWDGEKLVDVTPNYADEYRAKGAGIVKSVQEKYESSFRDSELLKILFLYEKAGLRDEAIEIFLELTNPLNWPNISQEEICWLQFARASATDDYLHERPFRFPEFRLEGAVVDIIDYQFADNFEPGFNIDDYDISACEDFMP